MKTIKFIVTVNPFLKSAKIQCEYKKCLYEKKLIYSDIDDWQTFKIDNRVFDIHFLYDTEFTVSIYNVENNKVDYSEKGKQEIKLNIKLTD